MAEYIEREAAIKMLRGETIAKFPMSYAYGLVAASEEIKAIPAADVVPVVRCGECKHWFDNGTDLCSCDRDALLRRRDFFCADGERKDGDGYGV